MKLMITASSAALALAVAVLAQASSLQAQAVEPVKIILAAGDDDPAAPSEGDTPGTEEDEGSRPDSDGPSEDDTPQQPGDGSNDARGGTDDGPGGCPFVNRPLELMT